MTLGCGAVAGNSTSDNIGPLHLINIKRIAYVARKAEEAFEKSEPSNAIGGVDRPAVVAAVERYLARRGVETAPPVISSVVDRFLASKRIPSAPSVESSSAISTPPETPPVPIADFVCEDDVRKAIAQSRKIYVGPKTIVTPSARDMALQSDTLVVTEPPKPLPSRDR
jgi:acetaldehyde dehydrogenase (acetylating)